MRQWGQPQHKRKHKHKNIKTLRSSYAYACAYVALTSSEDMFGISINISTTVLANQWTLGPRAPLPEMKWRAMRQQIWMKYSPSQLENCQYFTISRLKILKTNTRRKEGKKVLCYVRFVVCAGVCDGVKWQQVKEATNNLLRPPCWMCVWVRGNGHKNRLYACVYACAYVAVVLTGA